MFFKILWPSQNIQTLSNREITRNMYFNQSMTWTKIKKCCILALWPYYLILKKQQRKMPRSLASTKMCLGRSKCNNSQNTLLGIILKKSSRYLTSFNKSCYGIKYVICNFELFINYFCLIKFRFFEKASKIWS